MFAPYCRKIAGRPISIAGVAAGKLSLARAGFSAQSYKPPPQPPKLPRFPSMPNSIEGELRWQYEEYRASHENLVRSYNKSELSVHGKAAGQTFDFSYLSTDDLVILKGNILPDVVAFAQASGCSVSTSLMAETTTFSTMKAALGVAAALAASPHCVGVLGMAGAADAMFAAPVVMEQFSVLLMSLDSSVAILSSEVAATAAGVGLEAIVTEAVVAGVAEAGFLTPITGGLWKVLRTARWAYQAKKKTGRKPEETERARWGPQMPGRDESLSTEYPKVAGWFRAIWEGTHGMGFLPESLHLPGGYHILQRMVRSFPWHDGQVAP